jgi:tetratricopeptide (TPR) repeat protein
MPFFVLLQVLLALLLLSCGGGTSGFDYRMSTCALTQDPFRQIEICSELLQSGTLSSADVLWAYNNRAMAKARLGKTTDAFDDLAAALRRDPSFPAAYYSRGELFLRQGNFEEAIGEYGKALSASKEGSPQVGYNKSIAGDFADVRVLALLSRSTAFVELNQLNEAEKDCEAALEINPDDPRIHNNLGYVKLLKTQYDSAIVHYERALEFAPNYGQAAAGLNAAREALQKQGKQ